MKKIKIVILNAMQAEYAAVVNQMTHAETHRYAGVSVTEGMLFGKRCAVALSGVGKVAAAMSAQYLAEKYKPEVFLFTGVGGALNEQYAIGDVVLAADCVQHDLDGRGLGFALGQIPYTTIRFLASDERLLGIAKEAPIEHKIHTGRVLTGDQFIMNKSHEKFHYLTKELHGDAVDMEGAAVAYVCMVHQLPFLLIRTISDEANEHSPVNFEQFLPLVAENSVGILKHLITNLN
jgi:5'-methylthioadenosine/S-adenosylhomocysteine nucleosidase